MSPMNAPIRQHDPIVSWVAEHAEHTKGISTEVNEGNQGVPSHVIPSSFGIRHSSFVIYRTSDFLLALNSQPRTLNFSLPRQRGIMLRRLCSDNFSQLGGRLTIHTPAAVCKSSSCPTLFTFPATQLIPLAYASSSSSSSVVRPVMSGSSLSMAASIAARFFSCRRKIFSSTVSRVISL
jgi:hypothetical protein